MPYIEQSQEDAMNNEAIALYPRIQPPLQTDQIASLNNLLTAMVRHTNAWHATQAFDFDPSSRIDQTRIQDAVAFVQGQPTGRRLPPTSAMIQTGLKNFLRARNEALSFFDRPTADIDDQITALLASIRLSNRDPNRPVFLRIASFAAVRYLQTLKAQTIASIDGILNAAPTLSERFLRAENTLAGLPVEMTQQSWFSTQYLQARIPVLNQEVQTAAQLQFDNLVNTAAYLNGDDNAKQAILAGFVAVPAAGDEVGARFQILVTGAMTPIVARITAQTQFNDLGGLAGAAAYAGLDDNAKHDALTAAAAAVAVVAGDLAQQHLQQVLVPAALGIVNADINMAAQQQFDALTVNDMNYVNGDDQAKHNALTVVPVAANETGRRLQILIAAELVQVNARIAAGAAARAQFDDLGGAPGAAAYAGLDDNAKYAALTAAVAAPVVNDLAQNNFQTLVRTALVAVNQAIDTAAQQQFDNVVNDGAYLNGDDNAKQAILAGVVAVPAAGDEVGARFQIFVTDALVPITARIAAQLQFDNVVQAAAYLHGDDNAKQLILAGAVAAPIVGDVQQNHFQGLVAAALAQVTARIAAILAAQQQFDALTANDPNYVNGNDNARQAILGGAAQPQIHGNLQHNHFQRLVTAELLQVDARIAAQQQFDNLGGGYVGLDDNAKHVALTAAAGAPVVFGDLAQQHLKQVLVPAALGIVNAAIDMAAQQQFDALTVNDAHYVNGDDNHKHGVLTVVPVVANETNRRLQVLVAAELVQVNARRDAQTQFNDLGGAPGAAAYAGLDNNDKYTALTAAAAVAFVAGDLVQQHLKQVLVPAALGIVNAAIGMAAQQQFDNLGGGYAALPDDQAKRAVLAAIPAVPPVTETERRFRVLVSNELARFPQVTMTFSTAAEARSTIATAPNPADAEKIRQDFNRRRK